jgi:hypothetical protein
VLAVDRDRIGCLAESATVAIEAGFDENHLQVGIIADRGSQSGSIDLDYTNFLGIAKTPETLGSVIAPTSLYLEFCILILRAIEVAGFKKLRY